MPIAIRSQNTRRLPEVNFILRVVAGIRKQRSKNQSFSFGYRNRDSFRPSLATLQADIWSDGHVRPRIELRPFFRNNTAWTCI